jgi:DNA-directed RNA polymerase sigma subunit (sigma70/sigma32)
MTDADLHKVAQRLQVSVKELSFLLQASQGMLSFSQLIGESGRPLEDLIRDRIPDQGLFEADALVADAMDESLTALEKKILTWRFGFATGEPMTLDETAVEVGCSAEWVRRVERRALGKLRQLLGGNAGSAAMSGA